MNALFFALIGLTIGSAALLHFDRMSPAAMYLVELESLLGIPLPATLAVLAVLTHMVGKKLNTRTHREPAQPKARGSVVSRSPAGGPSTAEAQDWLEGIKLSAAQLDLPNGARMVFDLSRPYPLSLMLEQAPSERSKRAITTVGAWLAGIPTPPRIRIHFNRCPTSGSPRHHQVAGALAKHLNRADFKTIVDIDAVDVLFHHPDPRWMKSTP
jgi:hypothetical protein